MVEQSKIHMVGGTGDTSYAANSKPQEAAIFRTKPILEKAIEETYQKLLPRRMVAADLGCSSGPNTFLFASQVLGVISNLRRRTEQIKPPVEIQFFLNDLPGNDFNNIFKCLEKFETKMKEEKGDLLVPYYVAGIPGSFYGRLFPSSSVHFFHSSYCLHWLSQVPRGVEDDKGAPLNKGNVCIGETSPPEVVKAYQEQHRRDFSNFLKSRHEELCVGGRMVLTFLGRKEDDPSKGCLSHILGLVAEGLNAMASEGMIAEEKVDAFNMPIYGPSMEEVKSIIQSEGLLDLEQAHTVAVEQDEVFDDSVARGKLSANNLRAAIEPYLVAQGFEGAVLDELFSRYADYNSRDILKKKAAAKTELVLVLKKKTSSVNQA